MGSEMCIRDRLAHKSQARIVGRNYVYHKSPDNQKAFSPKAFANSSKAGFGSLHKLGEGLRVVHCDIRQNFSVKLYVGFFETVHKFAVR